VKIDIEGFELSALRGAERFISEHRPVILGEFSTIWSKERGLPADAAQIWARDHDYATLELRESRARWIAVQRCELRAMRTGQRRWGSDLLLVPRS
jgi:hypothetical protein